MRARTFGTAALVLTGLVLLVDVVRNLPADREDLGSGPAGFPWPTQGLGEVELGVDGAFVVELEERRASSEGAMERVPSMRLEGRDPRPNAAGMSLRDTVIRSYDLQAVSEEPVERLRVNSPRAILPMRKNEQGLSELDQTQAWQVSEPVVIVPRGLGGEELRLEADDAQYHPADQTIQSDGPFTLRSSGLELRGVGIHLDLARESVRFGEVDGRLHWQLALATGGLLRGFSDRGGVLEPVRDGHYELRLPAEDECWVELPNSSSMPGRLESEGFKLLLRQEGRDSVTDAAWHPEWLEGVGSTYWAGDRHIVLGGAPQLGWDTNGALLGLLIDGSILAHEQGRFSGWTTAAGGAYLHASTSELSLWDRVAARSSRFAVFADRVRVDSEERLHADGELLLTGQQGLSFAQSLEASQAQEAVHLRDVVAYPQVAEIDRVQTSSLWFEESGTMRIDVPFEARGKADGQAWDFAGQQLLAGDDPARGTWTQVDGGVSGSWQDARWVADSMEREGEVTQLRGAPAELFAKLGPEGEAYARAQSIRMLDDAVHLRGQPMLRVPAAALGLAGQPVEIRARQIERDAEGNWHFEQDVLFSGAMQGSARRAVYFADGSLELQRRSGADWMTFHLEDGAMARLKADELRGHPERELFLRGSLAIWFQQDPLEPPVELFGSRATLRPDGGSIDGNPTQFRQGEQSAHARRAEWTGDLQTGPWVMHLIGDAQFDTPQASGQAQRMRYDSASDALELFRGRKPARIVLQGGREVVADWLRYFVNDQRLDSRNGEIVPPDPGEQGS